MHLKLSGRVVLMHLKLSGRVLMYPNPRLSEREC
jgi:hypothetical protein